MTPDPFVNTPARPTPLPQYSPQTGEYSPSGGGQLGTVVAPGEVTLPNGTVVKGWVHVTPSGKVTIKPNANQVDSEGKKLEAREYELGDLNKNEDAARIRQTVKTMSMKANRILQTDNVNRGDHKGRDFRDPKAERKVPENRRSHGHASTVQMRGGYHKELEPADKGHAYTFNVKTNGDDIPAGSPSSSGASFSGYVVIAGVRKAVTGTADTYVRVYFDGSTPVYTSDGTCTDKYEAYLVSQTYGDIHESRT